MVLSLEDMEGGYNYSEIIVININLLTLFIVFFLKIDTME
jgi:hypothetical protein